LYLKICDKNILLNCIYKNVKISVAESVLILNFLQLKFLKTMILGGKNELATYVI